MTEQAFICDAVRTPIGRYGGTLSGIRTDDLGALPIKALMARNAKVDWALVEDVIYGCANQAGEDNRNVARMAGLLAGLPAAVTGATINRLCGSGMDAVGTAARAIKAGEATLMIAGGVESMSRAPFVMPKADSAFSRNNAVYDTTIGWRFINKLMKQQYGVDSMPETADNVAAEFGIGRADQDAFALRSQQRWAAAQAAGRFQDEIVPVAIPQKKGEPKLFDSDEHPRPDTTLEQLAKLKGINGPELTVTAGNASGVNDGACALLIASATIARTHGLTPKARVVAMATAGVAPRIMGFGPAPAVKKLLALTGLRLDQMDVIELNEAFAAQGLAVTRDLGLADDDARVNPNGGAIAIGHPLGMSGARLVTTAMYQLQRTGGRYALCTMCIGVGQGIAMIIERVWKITAADHFSAHAADYAKARPSYPPELFTWLAQQCPARDLAWDCATGNGQAAQGLAAHFRHVHATDLSSEQVAQARPHPRIDYRVAPAEASGLADRSCDLVAVAQALHWFCNDGFYAEVKRVLKPGGLFAAWTYTLLHGEPGLNALVQDFYTDTVGPWWPPERRWVDLGYRDMPFPFHDIATPKFEIRLEWTLADLLAYLRTWSATQRCIKETGTDPCTALGERLTEVWPHPETKKTIVWPIALRCGRLE